MTSPPPRPGRKALFLDLPPGEETPHEPVPDHTVLPAVPAVPEGIVQWFQGIGAGEWTAPPSKDTLPTEYQPLSEHLSGFWTAMNETREREKALIEAFSRIPYPAAVLDETGSLLAHSERYRVVAPPLGTSGVPDRIQLDDKTRSRLFDACEEVSEAVSVPGKEGLGDHPGTMTRRLIPFTSSTEKTTYALLVLEEEEAGPDDTQRAEELFSPTQVEERVAGALAAARDEMLQETTRLAGELAEARSTLDRLTPLPEVLLDSILTSFPVPAFRITGKGSICASNEHASSVTGSAPGAGPGSIDLRSLPLDTGTCDALIAAAGEGRGLVVKGEISREGTTVLCRAVLFPIPPTKDRDEGDSILLLVTGVGPAAEGDEVEHPGSAIPDQGTGTGTDEGEITGGPVEQSGETGYTGEPSGTEPGVEMIKNTMSPAEETGLPGTEQGLPDAAAVTEEHGEQEAPARDGLKAGPAPLFGKDETGLVPGDLTAPAAGDAGLTPPDAAHAAGSPGAMGTMETQQGQSTGGGLPHRPGEGPGPVATGENMADMTFDIVQFELAGEEYALDIRFSREIVEMMAITPIPRSPRHIAGVMNLRGEITTIININHLLGLEGGHDYTSKKIIVLSPETAGGENIGIIVDDVRSVLQIRGSDVEFFKGTGQAGSRLRMRGIIKLGAANASDRRPGSDEEKRLVIWVDMQQIIEEMMKDVQATGP